MPGVVGFDDSPTAVGGNSRDIHGVPGVGWTLMICVLLSVGFEVICDYMKEGKRRGRFRRSTLVIELHGQE